MALIVTSVLGLTLLLTLNIHMSNTSSPEIHTEYNYKTQDDLQPNKNGGSTFQNDVLVDFFKRINKDYPAANNENTPISDFVRPNVFEDKNGFHDSIYGSEKIIKMERPISQADQENKKSPELVLTCECYPLRHLVVCDGKGNPDFKLHDVLFSLPEPNPSSIGAIMLKNFNFGTIPNGTFKAFENLFTLWLIETNVTIIEPRAFVGLENVWDLTIRDIGYDGLKYLSKDMLLSFANLFVLDLGKVQSMDSNTFEAAPYLEEVYIRNKNTLLDFYHIFGKIKNLQKIIATNLGLTEFPLQDAFVTRLPLGLNFENNSISHISKAHMAQFKNASKLGLILANNDVRTIERDLFADIQKVWFLILRQNRKFGTRNMYTLIESLEHKEIDLLGLTKCGISIDKFDASILSPLRFSNLKMFNLIDNSIGSIESDAFDPVKHSLEGLEISNFMAIDPESIQSLHRLQTLAIYNMDEVVHGGPYLGMVDLNKLKDLKAILMSDIDSSRIKFRFDKLVLSIFTFFNMGNSLEDYKEQLITIMNNLDPVGTEDYPNMFMDLSQNLMFRYGAEELCSMFSHITVVTLSLSLNYFPYLPTCMFYKSNISELSLSGNKISVIQRGLFENMIQLRSLDLSQNAIQHIDRNAFVYMSIPDPYIQSTKNVKLGDNLLACDCENEPFRDWLIHKNESFDVILDQYCVSPASRKQEEFMRVKIPWMECNSELFTKICVISGSGVLVILVTTASLLKYFWKDIKYRQMVRRARKHNGYVPLNDAAEPDEEIYDAFVSYHPEKRIWVQDVMTPELKDGDVEFTLMYDVNIFPTGGESYFGGIFTHMDRSKHVIFLVTRGWMKEGMNEFEMEAAVDMLKQTKRHTLIVILMENIPKKEMSETLQLMVRNNVCLKWSENEREQRKFWRDLKLELGKKKYY